MSEAVAENSNTQSYVDKVIACFKSAISSQNGDITSLYYHDSLRDSNPFICALSDAHVNIPSYPITSSLCIIIHGWQAHSIEIVSYELNGQNYTCTLRFKFWDIYGLDKADVTKYNFSGFKSWYLLQHYTAKNGQYKPFINYIQFNKQFSASIS